MRMLGSQGAQVAQARQPPAAEEAVPPDLSIVVPMYNEAQNVAPLVHETVQALTGRAFELLLIDDGSTDATLAEALRLGPQIAALRVLRHASRRGQSAAVCSGVAAARAQWVATLDGDCQNDPRDILTLIAARAAACDETVKLVVGYRMQRRDGAWRELQSRVANGVRRRLLGDDTPDSGCGIKLIERHAFLALPRFDHMHRFLPALFLAAGLRVISVPVRHRPRAAGCSKYGMLDRLAAGIVDLVGVMWLARRHLSLHGARELTGQAPTLAAITRGKAQPLL
jgi:dolichol-phosphate mannosyltransferase